jgi:hypothetical protein
MSLTDRLRRIEQELAGVRAGAKATAIENVIVVEADTHLSTPQRARMQETLAEAVKGTGQRVLVLDGGLHLARPTDEQIDAVRQDIARVEGKLDALLAALDAEDETETGPSVTLDGDDAGGERDQSQPL